MSDHGHSHAADHGADHAHDHPNYVKIWGILLVLLVISVGGPFLGHPIITLITAFGIAVVKAYLVVKNFMHLNIQPKVVIYFLVTALVFMGVFFAGVAPDVMKHDGAHWENVAAKKATADALAAQEAHGGGEHH